MSAVELLLYIYGAGAILMLVSGALWMLFGKQSGSEGGSLMIVSAIFWPVFVVYFLIEGTVAFLEFIDKKRMGETTPADGSPMLRWSDS